MAYPSQAPPTRNTQPDSRKAPWTCQAGGAAEVPQLDDLGLSRIECCQSVECVVQRQHIETLAAERVRDLRQGAIVAKHVAFDGAAFRAGSTRICRIARGCRRSGRGAPTARPARRGRS